MKKNTQTNKATKLPAAVFNTDLSLYTGTLCTSLDVSRFARWLVQATTPNTQTRTPPTQEVDRGESCPCHPLHAELALTVDDNRSFNGQGAPLPEKYFRSKRAPVFVLPNRCILQ